MSAIQTRAERISQKNIRILEAQGPEIVQPHDDPSIKHEFDTTTCPDCGVPFVSNPERGSVDSYGNEETFYKVCPLCGSRPY